MFLTEDVWHTISQSYEDEDMEDRMGALQADLELFAEGQFIDPKYLSLLYPPSEGVLGNSKRAPAPLYKGAGSVCHEGCLCRN